MRIVTGQVAKLRFQVPQHHALNGDGRYRYCVLTQQASGYPKRKPSKGAQPIAATL
jgi:hypothetical protein